MVMEEEMIRSIQEEILDYHTYLLLQGPKGFFFYKLAKFLESLGKKVYKVNFNGGDLITFPSLKNVINYRDRIDKFANFFKELVLSKKIEAVLMYGDYRPYHQIARMVCQELQIPFYIFEEGYIRPDYITLEKNGINGFSKLPKDPNFYQTLPEIKNPEPQPVKFRFSRRVFSSILHYSFLELLRWYFPYYRPCKNYFPYLPYILGFVKRIFRKYLYKITERKYIKLFQNELKYKYFLVPLQVHNDTQITLHSNYNSIEDFITELIESFARNARPKHCLVFKHHPEDRGFKNYKKLIKKLSRNFNLEERVFYVHDLHLPTLIKNCLGVVVINSTVGLQALFYGKPVKVMGRAIYDISGLTFQGSVDNFWKRPGKIDKKLYYKFRNFVIRSCQLNGSFYGRFPFEKSILSKANVVTFSTASSIVKR